MILTTSENRAEELRTLVRAEAALREALGEEARVADVAVALSGDAEAEIMSSIHADAALSSIAVAPQVVLIR